MLQLLDGDRVAGVGQLWDYGAVSNTLIPGTRNLGGTLRIGSAFWGGKNRLVSRG